MKDFPQVNGWTVVPLAGDLDDWSAPDTGRLLDAVVGSGVVRLVVDLSAVTFVDSSGLNTLLGAARRARSADGQVHLAGPAPVVRDLIDLTGVGALLPLYPDVPSACA
ncbi:STAS domain-containing protein [Kitasatospora sp. NPDC004240]